MKYSNCNILQQYDLVITYFCDMRESLLLAMRNENNLGSVRFANFSLEAINAPIANDELKNIW